MGNRPSPSVVSIPASPLSISCGKPIACLFAGNLERYYRITASTALGQPIERVLHHVAQQFHGILPLAAWGAVGFGATLIHRETSFLGAWSILLYPHRFSQLNFTAVSEIDAKNLGLRLAARKRRVNSTPWTACCCVLIDPRLPGAPYLVQAERRKYPELTLAEFERLKKLNSEMVGKRDNSGPKTKTKSGSIKATASFNGVTQATMIASASVTLITISRKNRYRILLLSPVN